jgi:hypothetical protein
VKKPRFLFVGGIQFKFQVNSFNVVDDGSDIVVVKFSNLSTRNDVVSRDFYNLGVFKGAQLVKERTRGCARGDQQATKEAPSQ